MKSAKSTKPAKPSRAGGDFTTVVIGFAVICFAGLVMIVAARKSSNTAEMPVVAFASATTPQAMPAKAPVKPAGAKPGVVKPAMATPALPAAAPEPVKFAMAEPDPVTVTGCLERDDDTFRLKDTDVVMEPKGRSWKSGFLKKGSSSIEVIDEGKHLKLADHVGERVSVTGTLAYREMRARSMQRVASCK